MSDETDRINEPAEKASVPAMSPVQIILVLLIIAAVIEAATIISYRINPLRYEDYGRDQDMDDYFPGSDASARGGLEYLSDDEVKEAGTACTELEHFDLRGESLIGDISEILEEQGLGIADTDTSSFNQIYGDGGSWYETLITFSLSVPGDETGYQRLTLNCDTATGELHEIDLFISDKDRVLNLTEALLEMLNDHTDGTAVPDCGEMVNGLARSLERGENLYETSGTEESGYTALSLYCFEDGCSIYISREKMYGKLE